MPDHAEALAEALRPFEALSTDKDKDDEPVVIRTERWHLGRVTIGDLRRVRTALAAYDAAKQERRYGMEFVNRDKFEQKQD